MVEPSPARTARASLNAIWRGRPDARSYHAMRTNASRTDASRTSMVAHTAAGPSGSGRNSLSTPHARPPGTPTRSAAPSRPNDPRGVVRWYCGPSSADAAPATASTRTTTTRAAATFFDTCGPYPTRAVAWCRHFVRGLSHVRASEVSGEPHQPGPDLVWLEPDGRGIAIGIERRRGPHDVETDVSEVRLALPKVNRSR